jgi:hypothetical protein
MAMKGHTVDSSVADRHLGRMAGYIRVAEDSRMAVVSHVAVESSAMSNGHAGRFAMGAHKARNVAIECEIHGLERVHHG